MVCIVEVLEDGSEEHVPALEAVPRPRLALQGPDDPGPELPPIRLFDRPRLHYRVPLTRPAPGLAAPTRLPLLLQMRGDGDDVMDDSSAAAARAQKPAAVPQPEEGAMDTDAPQMSAAAPRVPQAALSKRGHNHVAAAAADDSDSDRNSDSDREPPFKRLRIKAPGPAASPPAKRKLSVDNVQEHFERCCIRSKC